MGRQLCVRLASAIGFLALAFLILGLDPFFRADPTAGASAPVERSFKGDRLPFFDAQRSYAPDWKQEFDAVMDKRPNAKTRAQIPVGCDPAFSPIAAPSKAPVVGRCLT